MFKRVFHLYVLTAGFVLLGVVLGFAALFGALAPSTDVLARQEHFHPYVDVDGIEPGEILHLAINGSPIVIWRRNDDDKALAARQNEPSLWKSEMSPVFGTDSMVDAHDRNLTVDGEWFLAISRAPIGHKTILMPREGDFDGFFDPLIGNHFDLSGRFMKGAYNRNMIIVPARMDSTGRRIQLDLGGVDGFPAQN